MNPDLLAGLPGESLVRRGLADAAAGRVTIHACLVAVGSPRLQRAGLWPSGGPPLEPEPERRLYAILRQAGGDAYSRYNSLLREWVSFEQALDHRLASKTLKS